MVPVCWYGVQPGPKSDLVQLVINSQLWLQQRLNGL